MPRPSNSAFSTSSALRISPRSGRPSSGNKASSSSRLRGRPAANKALPMMLRNSVFFSGFMGRLLTVDVDLYLVQVHFVLAHRRLDMDLREGFGLAQFDQVML